MEKKGKLLKGYAMIIVSAVIFGCMPLISRGMYADGMNSMSIVACRNLLSLPLLGILGWRQNGNLKISRKALPSIFFLAVLGPIGTPLLLFSSYQHISSGTATVFHFIYPAMVILMGTIFLKRKSTRKQLLCVVLCVLGIALFYDPKQKIDLFGGGLALVSGMAYAGYVLLLSVFKHKELTGFKLSFFVVLVSSVVLMVVCLTGNMLTMPKTLMGWACALVMAMVVNGIAMVLFQQGTFLIGGERASILSTFEPVTGVAVGILVLGEPVGPGMLAGTVLVILASILIAVFDMKKGE